MLGSSNLLYQIHDPQPTLNALEDDLSNQTGYRYQAATPAQQMEIGPNPDGTANNNNNNKNNNNNSNSNNNNAWTLESIAEPAQPQTTTMTGKYTSETATTLKKQKTLDHPSHSCSVSGARREVNTPQLQSPANIHKALPPVPPIDSSSSKPPQSATTNSSSFAHSHASTTRPSAASSVSSARSRSSSKTEFRIITRGLVNPDMAGGQVTLSPVEPDKYLHPTKYDPGKPPKSPRTPASFSSIMNANPYLNEPRSPMYMPPPLSLHKIGDPAKTHHHGRGIAQSHSEPTLYGLDGQHEPHTTQHPPTPSPGPPSGEVASSSRGRTVHRPSSPIKTLQDVNENEVLDVHKTSRKRSRSPVKRLLGLGKSTSLKDIAGEPQAQGNEEHLDKGKRTGLKVWSDRLKHGFLTSDSKPGQTTRPEGVKTTPPPRQASPAVSLDPPYQAKIYSEMELMVCVTANRYLVRERDAHRISAESVAKVGSYWSSKNRPQVIEFQYDQATQRDLIYYNLTTLKFHGESAESPLVLNATMYSWKTMAKEMSVRTFCAPDSQVRKHMHDTHKILEMLGAPLVTFLAFQELQLKTLTKITEGVKRMEEKRREERRKEIESGAETQSSKTPRGDVRTQHAGDAKPHVRKISKDDKERQVGKDVTENSRGGRLGLMIRADGYA